jgi:TaqI-like C-terminal specificity domain
MLEHEKEYYHQHFKYSWDKQNTFMLFMERILQLLDTYGRASFIVLNSWLTIESAKLLRILYVPRLSTMVDMNYAAFRGVAMEPSIFVVRGKPEPGMVETLRITKPEELLTIAKTFSDARKWKANGNRIHIDADRALTEFLSTIENSSVPIGRKFDVRTGLQAYEKGKGTPPQTARDVAEHVFDRTKKEDEHTLRYLQGGDVGRYLISWSGMWMQYGQWLSQPREIGIFSRPRILIREITGKLPYCIHATFLRRIFLNNKSVLNVLHASDNEDDLKCLVAVLNSKPFSMFYKARAVKGARTVFPKIVINNLRELPYPKTIRQKDKDSLCRLVDQIVEMIEQREKHADEYRRAALNRIIGEIDEKIDAIAARLYGLDEDAAQSLERTALEAVK